MTLADRIRIQVHYTRSANLERDIDSVASVERYIPTARALDTLRRVADSLEPARGGDGARAWSLVGPYGAGKSAFAVFLGDLLGGAASPTGAAARRVLAAAAPALAERYAALDAGGAGQCRVLLTGSPEPLSERLARALARGARAFHDGLPPSRRWPGPLLDRLDALADTPHPPLGGIADLLPRLQDAIAGAGGSGVLIVIDEMGRFLEYEARHGAADIHLLQMLAELAGRRHAAPLTLMVLLHQAFEQYASRLSETQRNEWTKIQGRFEHVPFVDSPEQVLRIVAAACRHDFDADEQALIRARVAGIATALLDAGVLPAPLDGAGATDLLAGCYPLHPLAALLLPPLCQRIAQNDRTLFSYLGSQEPHGFRDGLARLSGVGELIQPADLYDYFILNQPVAGFHHTWRRWNEVVTAIERLGDAPPEQAALLKTIGLLNILGAQGQLKASPALIALCGGPERERHLAELLARSIIQFRRFSNEYRVWPGSDFDLDAALARARAELRQIDVVAALNARDPPRPLVAQRHSIATGTLRWFQPRYVDLARLPVAAPASGTPLELGLEPEPGVAAAPTLLLVVREEDDEMSESALSARLGALPADQFAAVYPNAAALRESLIEVMAFESIRARAPELQGDPVASRELRERHAQAERQLEQERGWAFAQPGEARWFRAGGAERQSTELPIADRAGLQRALSALLDDLYPATPRIRNELINRDQPSSQASAGRNKLLLAMLESPDREDLGIEKFPAEKAMYRALLRAPGLHRPDEDGVWRFQRPPAEDPYNFAPLFAAIDDSLLRHEGRPLDLPALFARLGARPLGLKAGVLPILLIAYYLAHQREIALYEDGVFCPTVGPEHLELLARRPERFAIERFRLQGGRLLLFRKYLETLVGAIPEQATLLDIIRPLARFMRDLPPYAQKAAHPSEIARAIRDGFPRARGPAALLFQTLPEACGFGPIAIADTDEARMDAYLRALVAGLRELRDAYGALVEDFRRQLARAFGLDPNLDLARLRVTLRARCEGLDRHAGEDRQELRAFARRLSGTHHEDLPWLESVMTLLGRVPPAKWTEAQRQHALDTLADLATRLRDVETLVQAVRAQPTDAGQEVILLRTLSSARGEGTGRVARIRPEQRELIDRHAAALRARLADLDGDPDLRLAVLARLLED